MIQLVVLRAWLRVNHRDDRGASLVEYCLLVSLIALACFAALTALGTSVSGRYNAVGSSLG
jgi:Flp pilus assembly pilin Flp